MQRTIRHLVYDTDTAQLIRRFISGSFGDPDGYEECLYCTPTHHYFIYGIGGENSPYPKETLRSLSADAAERWLESHRDS